MSSTSDHILSVAMNHAWVAVPQEDDAPPRQPNMQGLLGMLVNGGTGEATAAETPADGPETQLAGTAQEQRAQALEQLLANFRDAFGDDNGGKRSLNLSLKTCNLQPTNLTSWPVDALPPCAYACCAAGGLEEALRASLEEEGALHGPPPAAKAAVKALVRERLTAERLEQLGGAGVQCSVCRSVPRHVLLFEGVRLDRKWLDAVRHIWYMPDFGSCRRRREELVAGVEIQLMPCNDHHVYHPACLAPWLQEHNSCPVCRHELPTDDQKYETRKQRAAAQAEELRGARSALTHNEFMYT